MLSFFIALTLFDNGVFIFMKLFGLEIRRIKDADTTLPNESRAAGSFNYFSGMTVKQMLSNTTVASCVSLIADTIGMLSCNVYKKTGQGREKDTRPTLSYVLTKKPNFIDTPFIFKQTIMMHLLLRGNAFLFIGRNPDFSVKSLIPLDPDLVEIKFDSNGDVYYQYNYNGKSYKYTSDYILHIPAYRYNTIRGLSPMEYANHAARLGLTLDEYTNDSFDGGIHSKLLVTVPKEESKWSKEDSQKLVERLTAAYGGRENQNKPMVLSRGLTAQPLNMATNQDSQLTENRTFSEKEVAKIYRVPLYMLGKDDGKFTNNEQANTFFLQNTLGPWMVRIQQYLDRLLTYPFASDHYVEFDPDTMLRADYKSRLEAERNGLQSGIYTLNQIMDMENLPRVKEDWGDKHFMPVNLSTMDKIAAQPLQNVKENSNEG